MNVRIPLLIVILADTQSGISQGNFQNLDFENATIVRLGSGYDASKAFPGWQVLYGASPNSVVGYDALSIGAPQVMLADNNNGYIAFQGNYAGYLQAANITFPFSLNESVSLSQTGLVPPGTQSIELDAYQAPQSSFVLTFDGAPVNMVPLQTFPNYTLYGGGVSQWAGQSADLSITELAPSDPAFSPSLLELDNIVFSPTVVTITPEPDALTLMGIGGALFAAYRRFAPKRR